MAQQELTLSGKKILISGASAGIGRETALLLANQGMQVLALGRRADALQALQDVAPAGSVRWLAGATTAAMDPRRDPPESCGCDENPVGLASFYDLGVAGNDGDPGRL